MAEIHVQPKKQASSSLWIWIVLAVLIGAVVLYFVVIRNKDQQNNAAKQPDTSLQKEVRPMPATKQQPFIPVVYAQSL